MGPLFPVLFAVLAPASWAAVSCMDAYNLNEHELVWEVTREAWAERCRRRPDPKKNLEDVKREFIEACVEKALASGHSGYYDGEELRELCANGAYASIKPFEDVPRRADASDHATVNAGRRLAVYQKSILGALESGGPALLYGERAAAGAAIAVPAPPSVGGVGVPSNAAEAQLAQSPRRPGLDQGRAPPTPDHFVQRALNIEIIQSRVVADGVSSAAVDRARFVIGHMLASADPVVVQNLVDRKVHCYIIPRDKKLTDLEPFKRLKGTQTFDGRLWDNVRGAASSRIPDDKGYAMAVGEEGLIESDEYYLSPTMVHEFGHMVQIHGLPTRFAPPLDALSLRERMQRSLLAYRKQTDRKRAMAMGLLALEKTQAPASFADTFYLYHATSKKAGKSNLGYYADANEKEFFAQLTAAYFDVGYAPEYSGGPAKDLDLQLLMRRRPELAQLMYRIYGSAPSLKEE